MAVLENQRHEAFAQALAKGKTQVEAYAIAGYKGDFTAASRLSSNVKVVARVAELAERSAGRAEIDIARVLKELVRLGTSDIRDAFTEDGALKQPKDWSDAFAASVASVEVVTKTLPGQADDELDAQLHGGALARKRNSKVEYVHKIKVWDKNSALEKIAKHLGMFIERVEHTGPDGGPIALAHSGEMSNLSAEERAAIRQMVEKRAKPAAWVEGEPDEE